MCSLTKSVPDHQSLESPDPDTAKISQGLVIESYFQNALSQEELFLLIESGIKFFLFQRGQIPLPYERLQVSRVTSTISSINSNTNISKKKETRSDLTDDTITNTNKGNETIEEDGSEIINGWRRIRILKKQGKIKRYEMLMSKKYSKAVEKEVIARSIWNDVFMQLRTIFLSSHALNITNIIIFFGPSIFNPKEMITFEIDSSLRRKLLDLTPGAVKSQHAAGPECFTPTLRSFYRSLIMSPEYLEFTTKPLRSTSSHVCILTSEMILDDNLRDNLVLVENFYTLHPESASPKVHATSKFHTKKKRLKVSMTLKSVNSESSKIEVHLEKSMSPPSQPLENRGDDLRINDAPNDLTGKAASAGGCIPQLINHTNNFCYQIPMRFRGISAHR